METEIKTLSLKENLDGRDFIVGDLHGNFDLLKLKLDDVGFDTTKDRLFSVGDLIDRGPKSVECLELLYEPWFYATIGNHELMFLTYMGEYYSSIHGKLEFISNGGVWISNVSGSMQCEYVELIKEKMYGVIEVAADKIETTGFIVTHSELDPSITFLDEFVWNRNLLRVIRSVPPVTNSIRDPNKPLVYVGHNPVSYPQLVLNHLMIDTGAFYTGNLSVVEHGRLLKGLE